MHKIELNFLNSSFAYALSLQQLNENLITYFFIIQYKETNRKHNCFSECCSNCNYLQSVLGNPVVLKSQKERTLKKYLKVNPNIDAKYLSPHLEAT